MKKLKYEITFKFGYDGGSWDLFVCAIEATGVYVAIALATDIFHKYHPTVKLTNLMDHHNLSIKATLLTKDDEVYLNV